MRRLATIRKITDIKPIENKDKIEISYIDGWQVITQKNLFKKNDLVVYIEPDSILPEKPEFSFMEKYKYKVKTIKIAGVISQGLIFPLNILPKNTPIEENLNVTNILKITQQEDEFVTKVEKTKNKKNNILYHIPFIKNIILERNQKDKQFPTFIKKTDEERIQNHPEYLNIPTKWFGTEKIDGTSVTYFLRKKGLFHRLEFGVCSRNLRLPKDDNSVYWQIAKKYNIKNKLLSVLNENEWVAIQGEIIAPNIQKNKYKISEPILYVYSILRPNFRLNSLESYELCQCLGLNHVPLLFDKKAIDLKKENVLNLLNLANGRSELNKEVLREGIVFRCENGSNSFKAVSPEFLLFHKI